MTDLAALAEAIRREYQPGLMDVPSDLGTKAVVLRALADTIDTLAVTEHPHEVFAITAAHLARQREFSQNTFGPGPRLAGVLDHIRKELAEVEAEPQDITEWADVVILAFDGALRQGHDPQAILDAILAKQTRNESRAWPDWRTQPSDRAIEHIRIETDLTNTLSENTTALAEEQPDNREEHWLSDVSDDRTGRPADWRWVATCSCSNPDTSGDGLTTFRGTSIPDAVNQWHEHALAKESTHR